MSLKLVGGTVVAIPPSELADMRRPDPNSRTPQERRLKALARRVDVTTALVSAAKAVQRLEASGGLTGPSPLKPLYDEIDRVEQEVPLGR